MRFLKKELQQHKLRAKHCLTLVIFTWLGNLNELPHLALKSMALGSRSNGFWDTDAGLDILSHTVTDWDHTAIAHRLGGTVIPNILCLHFWYHMIRHNTAIQHIWQVFWKSPRNPLFILFTAVVGRIAKCIMSRTCGSETFTFQKKCHLLNYKKVTEQEKTLKWMYLSTQQVSCPCVFLAGLNLHA